MIKLFKADDLIVETMGAIVLNWDVRKHEMAPRPVNHNLTQEARAGNVVILSRRFPPSNFRPDLGARVCTAA